MWISRPFDTPCFWWPDSGSLGSAAKIELWHRKQAMFVAQCYAVTPRKARSEEVCLEGSWTELFDAEAPVGVHDLLGPGRVVK